MGNSTLNIYICIYIHIAFPYIFAQRVPGNAITRAHRRGNARANQSSLAPKEGLVYTCKHEQNKDEAYLSSQMWTLKPCQGLFQFFIEGVTWPHPRGLAHSFMGPRLGKCFMFANLWACRAVTMFAHHSPSCVLGFGALFTCQWHLSTRHTNKHRSRLPRRVQKLCYGCDHGGLWFSFVF